MYRFMLSFLTFIVLLFSGCWSGSSGSSSTAGAGGAGMKGPFVRDSNVTAYKLDDNGSRSSTFTSTTTTDNLGHYSFSSLSWTGATEIVMSGNYFNENNGSTAATASLSAIIDVLSGQVISANINVLTNLEAQRIKALMLANTPLATAKTQARDAVVELFDLNISATTNLEDLDLTDGSGSLASANAELLRISAAIAAQPAILAQLEDAIEDGNVTNDTNGSSAFTTLVQAVNSVNLDQVANNLEQNLSITGVPDTNDSNSSFASTLHAPVITSNSGTETANIDLNENTTAVTTVVASDADGDTLTYSIVGGEDQNKFNINQTTGVLSFKSAPDFENPTDNGVNNTYVVEVSASDGTLIDTQTITVTVENTNDNAPVFTNAPTTSVAENQADAITLSATDEEDDNLTFSISGGVDALGVSVDSSTGVVTFINPPDYETKTSYTFTATVSDGVNNTDQNVTINILDIPDVVPVLLPTNISVSEGVTTGTTIGVVNVSSTGDTPISAYTIVSGGDGKFAVENNGTVRTVGVLDYETKPNYTLVVNATSSAGTSANVDLTINLTDVVDTPPTLAPFTGSVDENSNIGEIVGDVNITSLGDGNITGFVLSDTNFEVNTNGKIITRGSLNHESNPVYNFTMYATSSAGDSNTINVTVVVNDVNEAPVASDANFTTQQDTNLSINLQPYVQDEDANQDIVGTVLSSTTNGTLVDNHDGTFIYSPNSGYTGSDSFTYKVEDNGTNPGPFSSNAATVHITVTATSAPSNGQAIDPYIVGAQFWADVNGDGVQDANETSTLSDVNGSFSFQIFVPDDTNVTMIRQGLHNGKPFDGNISAKFKASRDGIISPITTMEVKGFSDSELVDMFRNAGLTNISSADLYLDPFDVSLLPLDGNMSSYSDADINKFSRVLIANVALNMVLTMGNGYGMNKEQIRSNFIDNGVLSLMVNAGKSVLTVDTLKNTHARVMARIFVNVSSYIRDRMIADSNYDFTNDSSIQSMISTLISAYIQALQTGLSDPKFGWVDVEDDGNYTPMLFIQPNELGNHDVVIVYDDNNNDINITFASNNHNFFEGTTQQGQWQISNGKVQVNGKEFELLGDKIKVNGIVHDILEVRYNGINFIPSTTQSSSTFSGAADPGDFANFAINNNQLDFNITGSVFNSLSGTLALHDVTGNGVFFMSDIGNGNLVKIAKASNLAMAVVPVNTNDTTMIMGLQVSQNDINESAIWDKSYIYAEMGNDNGNRYVDGYIMQVNQNHTVSIMDTGGSTNGCWKTIGNHIVVKMGTSDCSTVDDSNAEARVVIRPPVASGRSGMIVDLANGGGIGIGLEQRAISMSDMTGIYDAYQYDFSTSDEIFYQVEVANDGSNASYRLTPYLCDQSGCSLDQDTSHQITGNIAINKLCDGSQYDNGTDINGVMCAENAGMGFIDPDEGYFMIANDDFMIFGSKQQP